MLAYPVLRVPQFATVQRLTHASDRLEQQQGASDVAYLKKNVRKCVARGNTVSSNTAPFRVNRSSGPDNEASSKTIRAHTASRY